MSVTQSGWWSVAEEGKCLVQVRAGAAVVERDGVRLLAELLSALVDSYREVQIARRRYVQQPL